MALVLLLSTVSWTVEKHLCMGRVMDISLFSKAKDCGMVAAMATFEDDSTENNCCENESITILAQEDLKLSLGDISFDQQVFLVAFTNSFLFLRNVDGRKALSNEYYPPPILIKDIQLLDEVFLI